MKQNPQDGLAEREFKVYRNKLQRAIKLAKANYYKTLIREHQNNSAELWKKINNILCKKHPKDTISEIKAPGGLLVVNKNKIVEILADYYNTIGGKVAKDIVQDHTVVLIK